MTREGCGPCRPLPLFQELSMSVVCIVWSSHAGSLAAAASLPGMPPVRVLSSRMLEVPEDADRCREIMHSASSLFIFRTTDSLWDQLDDDIRHMGKTIPVVCVSYDPAAWALSSVSAETAQTAYRYLTYGGTENICNLFRFLHALPDIPSDIPEPLPAPWEGLWHPDASVRSFDTPEAYQMWYTGHARRHGIELKPERTVGLLFGRHYWVNAMPDVETALVRALESKGLAVIPAFTNTLRDKSTGNKGAALWTQEAFLDGSKSRIGVLVKFLPYFTNNHEKMTTFVGDDSPAWESVHAFRALGVPVFQPVFASSRTLEEWEADPQGLSSEVSWAVAMPEFEGTIEPFFLGGGTLFQPGVDGMEIERRTPHAERVERFASRIARWLRLRNKPAAERRVAFLLNSDPCASVEASIGGAAKLDSLESVSRILKIMKQAGYSVEVPDSGTALINTMLERKAISEFRWTTVQEIEGKGGVLAHIDLSTYQTWFDSYPEAIRKQITKVWGNPPGESVNGVPAAMVLDGNILVTGIQWGNAVVCIQPKRGCAGSRCDGQVCKILHDPSVPPPHQYLATYRWLQDGFGADVLIHVGTHGNLEFLPGKSVGLSESCLPDLALHEIPHVYIYNSDNPPEGVIAKRRGYAELVDHMQTVMVQGGLYDTLEELDRLLGEWEQARNGNPARAHQLEHLIREGIVAAKLESQVSPDTAPDFAVLASRVHTALGLLRNTYMEDGMHIFGETPQDGRRAQFIASIVRYDAGQTDSLRKRLYAAQGLELDRILAEPEGVDAYSRQSHASLLEKVEKQLVAICEMLVEGTRPEELPEQACSLLGDSCVVPDALQGLVSIGHRILNIITRIEATDEMGALLEAISGHYVLPGPSGIITRGREDILPTGRNFYTLDPRRLPTRAAWRVGQNLARAVIARHMEEEGRYPENIAMFWMCNDMMWADGEGMGQLFYLLGVVPRWLGNGMVEGFDIIPLEELQRPRIDVTVRVSGLLRDSFPMAMNMLDEAIQAVAALDEAPEDNFVRKHTLARLAEIEPEAPDAWRSATFRIFSSEPGTYQAGVNLAVYASAWQTEADLADIFIHWNGYAYGKDAFGVKRPKALEASLSTVDVTYNKVVSDEHDLFNCCGYYGTHGGMTAAASHFRGEQVKTYYGDTREPEQVQVRDLADEVRRVVRARLLNPKWIEGMKRHGYKGAGDISKRAGRVYGWEATTQAVDDWIFDDIARTFVLDPENRAFFDKNNPWALEEIARRLLEAEARNLWQADPDVLSELREAYMDIEGILEEHTESFGGEFQGGAIDIVTPNDVSEWKKALEAMRGHDK